MKKGPSTNLRAKNPAQQKNRPHDYFFSLQINCFSFLLLSLMTLEDQRRLFFPKKICPWYWPSDLNLWFSQQLPVDFCGYLWKSVGFPFFYQTFLRNVTFPIPLTDHEERHTFFYETIFFCHGSKKLRNEGEAILFLRTRGFFPFPCPPSLVSAAKICMACEENHFTLVMKRFLVIIKIFFHNNNSSCNWMLTFLIHRLSGLVNSIENLNQNFGTKTYEKKFLSLSCLT